MTVDRWAAFRRDALLTVVLVATLAALVVSGATERLDRAAVTGATDLTRAYPGLRDALILLEELTRPVWLYAVATAVCIVAAAWGRMPGRALGAWATMMAIWASAALLKLAVGRERPAVADPVWDHGGLSFPSGHATNSTAMALGLTLLLRPLAAPLSRRLLAAGAVLLVTVVGLDRVFLGVHYPSDVVAGLLFGGGLMLAGSRVWPSALPAHTQPAHTSGQSERRSLEHVQPEPQPRLEEQPKPAAAPRQSLAWRARPKE